MKSQNNIQIKPIHLNTISYPGCKPAFFFAFAMHLITATLPLHVADNPGNETDRVALLSIKSQLVDHPNGVLTSWNDSIHHCNWDGVFCGHKHNRVTELDLSSRGLAGTISPFIGNMSFLEIILLYNNSLYGEIPKQVSHLFMLQQLGLQNNTFVGEIPANISRCVNLRYISLGYNKLEGKLPTGLAALSELELLDVHNNYFRGPLFDVIQNLTSLVYISASYNSFTGSIPNSIGRMRSLTTLLAVKNNLSGKLPASLFNLSSLQVLEISFNKLRGRLPARMGLTIPYLKKLNIAGNDFSGSFPITIRNLTSLEFIELQENAFTGRVPQDFGHFHNLTNLNFRDNLLRGDINFITTLVNCSKLNLLSLKGNLFFGNLPESVANLSTTLTWLTLGGKFISGTFPAGITNLINLERLIMVNTKLTASLPRDFGKLQKLQEIRLSSNRLTGKIPDSVGNLSRLSTFYINNNKLDGSIPESIGNCQSLLQLYLTNNNFSGSLSRKLFDGAAKFVGISLSRNHIEGSLPFEISKQINLIRFEVSNNKLSGVIPDSLGDCTTLQYLDMSGNLFHGSIPPSLTSLSSLEKIDLSRNHLSGQIPAYLSKFPLTYLNLSSNQFEGRIPTTGVFANVSNVFLGGNNGLCGGVQALHLPRCVVENKITEKKKRSLFNSLQKVVISTVLTLVGVLAVSLGLFIIVRRNKRRPISSTSTSEEKFATVSYGMLLKATSGFSAEDLLGEGSSGSVFKGVLQEKIIAVKVLNMQHHGASKSFIAECKALRNIRHRNLVGIITVCSSIDFQQNDFRALVYEFMPNGSVDRWLHGVTRKMSLAQRVDVAIDVAHALDYLHHECDIPIIHCDLKPSNVLLDNDMVAHVGDFGISKFLTQPRHPNESTTIGIRGTIGYAAPEYGLGSEASPDGDVYSYGILLLELMTGKSPTDNMFKEDYNLHMYAKEAVPDQVLQIADPTFDEDSHTADADGKRSTQNALQRRIECIISVIGVGVSCSKHLPNQRMKITEAISRLQSVKDNLPSARKKA